MNERINSRLFNADSSKDASIALSHRDDPFGCAPERSFARNSIIVYFMRVCLSTASRMPVYFISI
jgi:hypothetical protein